MMELVLASASPARLKILTAAGLRPRVVVSEVDESQFVATEVAELSGQLARAKAEAVAARLTAASTVPTDRLVLGCDSLLEFDGEAMGKPGEPTEAICRWQRMRGRSGWLHTGHHLIRTGAQPGVAAATGSTKIEFAELSDAEIEAYVATGEPLQVAGGFTIDGLGGAFIHRIEGDPHNVVGLSLPLLRQLAAELGVPWPSLWS